MGFLTKKKKAIKSEEIMAFWPHVYGEYESPSILYKGLSPLLWEILNPHVHGEYGSSPPLWEIC